MTLSLLKDVSQNFFEVCFPNFLLFIQSSVYFTFPANIQEYMKNQVQMNQVQIYTTS